MPDVKVVAGLVRNTFFARVVEGTERAEKPHVYRLHVDHGGKTNITIVYGEGTVKLPNRSLTDVEFEVTMSRTKKLGRQTKWGANISVNLLRQAYDSVLLEPIPEGLVKATSVLAEVAVKHLAAMEAMRAEAHISEHASSVES